MYLFTIWLFFIGYFLIVFYSGYYGKTRFLVYNQGCSIVCLFTSSIVSFAIILYLFRAFFDKRCFFSFILTSWLLEEFSSFFSSSNWFCKVIAFCDIFSRKLFYLLMTLSVLLGSLISLTLSSNWMVFCLSGPR